MPPYFDSIENRLLRREIGNISRWANIPGLYGDTRLVKQLDIVDELQGHTGCVNSLTWSTSGRILASGSDDLSVNLFKYQPEQSQDQFSLMTTIHTGHTRNIFSVRFMPHSGDRNLVTAAGDGQVRIFDIERASILGGERASLSIESASGKVFRSHRGRVKRIVTEDSPFYFLTCSEDGDVRQWDIRQPESTYPDTSSSYNPTAIQNEGPPPLISYSDYNIDLHTISCSPCQPQYIAIGGTHLHVFLHDRRMLGRSKTHESGGKPSSSPTTSRQDSDMMNATRCVKKFAPHGQLIMVRNSNPSVTACKISNAEPNELIASWSNDKIYSFNILKAEEDERAAYAEKLQAEKADQAKK